MDYAQGGWNENISIGTLIRILIGTGTSINWKPCDSKSDIIIAIYYLFWKVFCSLTLD